MAYASKFGQPVLSLLAGWNEEDLDLPGLAAAPLLVCVFWPAWVWIDHPESRWLFASHREALAIRDSLRCRTLIESDWYQRRWGNLFQLRKDQNQKQRFENDRTGYRVVVPMSAGTGERGDYVVVDDPHTVDQAESDAERTAAVEWWNGSMSTRLNDPSKGHKVVIQQRLHESDLTGDLLQRGGYAHLCLPAEFEPDRRCGTSIGWQDPRTEAGELLCPQRFNHAALEEYKTALGRWHAETALVGILAATRGELAARGREVAERHHRTSQSGRTSYRFRL